jgi:hypothetical protein
MAPFLVGRVGASKDAPVPDSGTPTLHGLPPSIGVGGDRFKTCQSGVIMTTSPTGKSSQKPRSLTETASHTLAKQLPGTGSDSEGVAIELHQLAHNALASAAWHVARGESSQALSRIRRAQAHLSHAIEGGAA